jgi:hypothetical protein
MTVVRVYYTADGEIVGHDNSVTAHEMPGVNFAMVVVPDGQAIHPSYKLHKIVDGALVDKTHAERAAANAPTELEVRQARYFELKEFDWRESQPAWAAHRQALRDLTKAGDAAAMVKAWPLRPDGTDAIAHLRRLET